MSENTMGEIKYIPGDRVCFIRDRNIVMARVRCTIYDIDAQEFIFLLDKYAKNFSEDELFFNFSDAQDFLDKQNGND